MAARSEPFGFRTILQRLGRRVSGGSDPLPDEAETSAAEGSAEQIARRALAMMLEEAVGVLKALGLPHRSGFYRWDPHRLEWAFLSSRMTPAERWAMVLEAPAGEGWRYATLPQLVREARPDEEMVRQAAEILEQGAACLARADQPGAGGVEAAVKLAVAWAEFQVARIVPIADRREPLRLYFPPEEPAAHLPPARAPSKKTGKSRPARKMKSGGKA